MNGIFIDTNILIDYSHLKESTLSNTFKKDETIDLFINSVVIAEFLNDRNLTDQKKLEKAQDFISFFTVLEITGKIGFTAGELLREKKTNFLGDAFIAATCLIYELPLLTRNKKHFQKIPQLKLFDETKSQ